MWRWRQQFASTPVASSASFLEMKTDPLEEGALFIATGEKGRPPVSENRRLEGATAEASLDLEVDGSAAAQALNSEIACSA